MTFYSSLKWLSLTSVMDEITVIFGIFNLGFWSLEFSYLSELRGCHFFLAS